MSKTEKILKNELGLSKKAKAVFAVWVVLFVIVSLFVFFSIYNNTKQRVMSQALDSITNISRMNERSFTLSIRNRRLLLGTVADSLSKNGIRDIDEVLRLLDDYTAAYEFYRMGVLDKNKIFYQTNGDVRDVSSRPEADLIWGDLPQITASYMPSDGGEDMVNMFSCPVYYEGELEYVIVATYLSKNLVERMNISSLGNKGHNYIINSDGDVVVYPSSYENAEYLALMRYINDMPSIIPDESGNGSFDYNGERYYAHFEKIEIADWYLMSCAKESDTFAQANYIIGNVLLGMGMLWLMIIVAVSGILYTISRSKNELRRHVFFDDLLGIGNGKYLKVVFRQFTPEDMENMFLVAFDIDKFKEFNYIYGEDSGDNLLKYVVRVFNEEFPDMELYRYVSDYFITLDRSRTREECEAHINRLLSRFRSDIESGVIQPFDISAGIRKVNRTDTLRHIISDALIARDAIKGTQLQHYAFYDENIRSRRISYMEMESQFPTAIKDREFKVYYQPKYDMNAERIIGAEALVRWIQPDGRIISPGEFIPCFETSRQVVLLDQFMLEEVCRQMKDMEHEGIEVKVISVNLSRVNIRNQGILPKIAEIVKTSGVDPKKLSFEITESALYEDSIPLRQIVDFLHNLGCKVDMDDFGVGVSGPTALAMNDFDMIKLDKSFIDGIGNERMETVIKSTIRMASELGMDILAEGVEEQYQAELLVDWGCEFAQGYYYAKPMTETEYRRLLLEDMSR